MMFNRYVLKIQQSEVFLGLLLFLHSYHSFRLMRKVASRMNKVFEDEIEQELGFKKDAEDEATLK